MTEAVRVYVAGPMESAGGNWNMPLFDYVTAKLRERGCEVFSPAEHLINAHGSLEAVLKLDPATRKTARNQALRDEILWIMDRAQLVLLLPGWERSPGAMAERAVALAIKLEVRETGTILLPPGGEKVDPNPFAGLNLQISE